MTKNKRAIWVINSNRWNSAITEYTLQLALVLSKTFKVIYSPLRGSIPEKRALACGLTVIPFENFGISESDRFNYVKTQQTPFFIFTTGGKETTLLAFSQKPSHETRIRIKGDNLKSGWIRGFLFKTIHKTFDGFLVPSSIIAKQIKLTKKQKLNVIELGLNEKQFFYQRNVKIEEPRILIFGRLDPVKGHTRFMQIFSEFLKRNPDNKTKLHIYGREENVKFEDLVTKAKSLGIDDKVVYKSGTIENVRNEMGAASLGIIPSEGSELICRVAYEFVMCGVPVLVSGVGATEETLKNDNFGASYKNLSDIDASIVLEKLLQKVSAQHFSGAKLAKDAENHFSHRSMGIKLENFLEDLSIFGV